MFDLSSGVLALCSLRLALATRKIKGKRAALGLWHECISTQHHDYINGALEVKKDIKP